MSSFLPSFRTLIASSAVFSLGACSLLVLEDDLTPDLGERETSGSEEEESQETNSPGSTNSGGGGEGGATDPGASTGGAPAPEPGELGASCSEASDCGSGFCADGLCCDAACDGTCEMCGADGLCDETPDDDDACGVISCSVGNNECLTYESQITQSRCADFGVCKTGADCGTSNVDDGTTCTLGAADNSVCRDGLCSLPQVECNDTACTIDEPTQCCQINDAQACTTSCVTTALGTDPTSSTPRRTSITCDAHTDCRPGTLCTLVSTNGSLITCSDRPNTSGTGVNRYEVCQSPTMPEQPCSNGGACNSEPLGAYFSGNWKFCARP